MPRKPATILIVIDEQDIKPLIRAQHVLSQLATKHEDILLLREVNANLSDALIRAFERKGFPHVD